MNCKLPEQSLQRLKEVGEGGLWSIGGCKACTLMWRTDFIMEMKGKTYVLALAKCFFTTIHSSGKQTLCY